MKLSRLFQGLSFDLSRVRSSCHPLDTPEHTGDNNQPRAYSSRGLRCRGEILQCSSKPSRRFEASSIEFDGEGTTRDPGRAIRIHG
jgi:hypothetical protein